MWVKTADALSYYELLSDGFDLIFLPWNISFKIILKVKWLLSLPQACICSGSLIGERGQFWRKRRSRLLYDSYTCVCSTVITTVISAHLTVEGSKVTRIHKLRCLKCPNLVDLDQAVLCNTLALTLLKIIFHPNFIINSPSSRPKPAWLSVFSVDV